MQVITKLTCDIMVLLIKRIKLFRDPQAAVDVPSRLAQHVHGHAGGETETELFKKPLWFSFSVSVEYSHSHFHTTDSGLTVSVPLHFTTL